MAQIGMIVDDTTIGRGYGRYVLHERVELMAGRMLALILLSILVVIFCECGKDKEKEQAKDTPGEVDKARAITGKDGAEMVLIPAGEFEITEPFPGPIPEFSQWAKKYFSGPVASPNQTPRPTLSVFVAQDANVISY